MLLECAAAAIFLVVLSNVLFWPRVKRGAGKPDFAKQISVLIPARDEEHNIGTCLDSVLRQGAAVAEVLVYDDHSTDATNAVVRGFALRDSRVRLVDAQPLPPDWCGKNFACAQLALAATGDWLLFLDADARLTDGAADGILETVMSRNLTMLSCWPGFLLINFSERALMPLLNFVVFSIFPSVLSLVRNESSLGLAHGACLMMHRNTYEGMGGHGAVRGEIFEDTRLAQHWRMGGGRALCLDGQDVVRVRMYANFPQIWRGFQKNFFPAFQHETVFWAFLIFHFTVFLLPFLIGNWRAAGFVILSRFLLALRFSQPWWSALAHPLAEISMLLLGLSSWWHCRTGKGVQWKGRVYRARRV